MVDAVLGDLWHLRSTVATPGIAAREDGAPPSGDQGMIRRR